MQAQEQENTTFNWPPLESNPEIFASYMSKLGLPSNWSFGELYGFEEDLLGFVPQPCLAVIVNAERLKKSEDKERGDMAVPVDYYMDQTEKLDNACGVIACIHAIYNNLGGDKINLPEDSVLAKFFTTVNNLSAAEKAKSLEDFTDF